MPSRKKCNICVVKNQCRIMKILTDFKMECYKDLQKVCKKCKAKHQNNCIDCKKFKWQQ